MKKSLKIILGIVLATLITIVCYIVLIIKGILPNPFLDTSDLVCVRTSHTADTYVYKEVTTITFDSFAIVKDIKEEFFMEFNTAELAKEYYDMFAEYMEEEKFKLENNIVYNYGIIKIDKENNFYNKTKTEIKKIYENEYIFECK